MQQKNSKRKFLLVFPLLVIPFLTFAFWALGGGKGNADPAKVNAGLNLQLPGASLKDDHAVDKLGYYEKAESDSDKLKELMKNDPYLKSSVHDEDTMVDRSMSSILPEAKSKTDNFKSQSDNFKSKNYSGKNYTDPNEEKVYKKLEQLNSVMNANEKFHTPEKNPVTEKLQSISNDDAGRLEQMMKTMSTNDNGDDPEMKQLNGMMEKILDIQHPERVKEKIKEQSIKNKENVYPVTVTDEDNVSLLEPADTVKHDSSNLHVLRQAQHDTINNFYSLNDDAEMQTHNSVEAVIHETQTLVAGAPVKLRLLDDIYINGVLIPKDNFIFGTASINGERLKITINSIHYKNSLLPVALSIYDIDGMEGIYIPGAITRDVAKQSADNALQNIGVTSIDPSIGSQALGMGIEAGKNLLSKKAKVIRVTVKAGYKVLLKDNNNK